MAYNVLQLYAALCCACGKVAYRVLLYEVPTYLAQNFNWNDKQKNKKKKSDGKNKLYEL